MVNQGRVFPKRVFGMIEEIKAKADELGQFYFPDECNVWARENIEAKFVSSVCTEMAEWMQNTMIEKACKYLGQSLYNTPIFEYDEDETPVNYVCVSCCDSVEEFIENFRKAMEE